MVISEVIQGRVAHTSSSSVSPSLIGMESLNDQIFNAPAHWTDNIDPFLYHPEPEWEQKCQEMSLPEHDNNSSLPFLGDMQSQLSPVSNVRDANDQMRLELNPLDRWRNSSPDMEAASLIDIMDYAAC